MSTYGKINNFHMKHFFELFRLVISFFKDSSSIYISSLFTIFFFNSLFLSLSLLQISISFQDDQNYPILDQKTPSRKKKKIQPLSSSSRIKKKRGTDANTPRMEAHSLPLPLPNSARSQSSNSSLRGKLGNWGAIGRRKSSQSPLISPRPPRRIGYQFVYRADSRIAIDTVRVCTAKSNPPLLLLLHRHRDVRCRCKGGGPEEERRARRNEIWKPVPNTRGRFG